LEGDQDIDSVETLISSSSFPPLRASPVKSGYLKEQDEENRFALVTRARLSERAERYDDMLKFMKQVAKANYSRGLLMTIEERNLLSIACKNGMASHRTAWRCINKLVLSQNDNFTRQRSAHPENLKKLEELEAEVELTKTYRLELMKQAVGYIKGVLDLIEEIVIPTNFKLWKDFALPVLASMTRKQTQPPTLEDVKVRREA
jgi:hypothetical protein